MSPDDIAAKAQATAERDALIAELRNRTALARLNQSEAVAIFDEIAALGFTLTKAG
ncbi:hypothetical protein WHZ78_17610 [Bradyrhizobium symbiodeficiens]|uniref:hypothetical protein n=1 Tax=Bradyrhizobium symbiodeficiens TaxID=1404367 RepID=UPI0030CF7339